MMADINVPCSNKPLTKKLPVLASVFSWEHLANPKFLLKVQNISYYLIMDNSTKELV